MRCILLLAILIVSVLPLMGMVNGNINIVNVETKYSPLQQARNFRHNTFRLESHPIVHKIARSHSSAKFFDRQIDEWNITTTITIEDTTYICDKTINILSGGALILRNATLKMNLSAQGEHWIEVFGGGNLTLINSTITSLYTNNRYYIVLRSGAIFYSRESKIEYAGFEEGLRSGIYVENCSFELYNTTIQNNYIGILMNGTEGAIVNGCRILDSNTYEIYLLNSTMCEIVNNELGYGGIFILGVSKKHYNHIVTNNTISGDKVIYVFDKENLDIDTPYGQVIVAFSSNLSVSNQNMSYVRMGITIMHSKNITVADCNFTSTPFIAVYLYNSSLCNVNNNYLYVDVKYGVYVEQSTLCQISYNNITTISGDHSGIFIYRSINCVVGFNNVTAGSSVKGGIRLENSSRIIIKNNSVTINNYGYGIYCKYCSNLSVYNNTGYGVSRYSKYFIDLEFSSGIIMHNVALKDARILIEYCDGCNITKNSFIDSRFWEVEIEYSSNIIIIHNNFSGDGNGVRIYYVDNILVAYNNVSSDGSGLRIHFSTNVTILRNIFMYCGDAIYAYSSENVMIHNNTMKEMRDGIEIGYVTNSSIVGNMVNGSQSYYDGIRILDSDNVTVRNNTAINNDWGLFISGSHNVYAEDNIINNNTEGMYIHNCKNIRIVGFKILDNNVYGIYVEQSWNISIMDSNIMYTGYKDPYSSGGIGLFVAGLTNITIVNCEITHNYVYNVYIKNTDIAIIRNTRIGYIYREFISEFSTTTPLHLFLANTHNVIMYNVSIIDEIIYECYGLKINGGGNIEIYLLSVIGCTLSDIAIKNAENITVANVSVRSSMFGLALYGCTNVSLSGVYAYDCYQGIYVGETNNCSVISLELFWNGYGIYVWNSTNIIVVDGTIMGNDYGIVLNISTNVSISYNAIVNNKYGIFVTCSGGCIIYLNELTNNTVQAFDDGANAFNNSCLGNYWSDYNGVDENYDGIGDVPYYIDNDSIDYYPLMLSPFIDADNDGMADEWEVANGFDPLDPSDGILDADSDGLPNSGEYRYGADPYNNDTDSDGLVDGLEIELNTDLTCEDTDGDSIIDSWEVLYNLDPLNPLDASEDVDGDGLTNIEEYNLGTDPTSPDTDGDGISDAWEIINGLNPLDPSDSLEDPDQDDLTNVEEYECGTDPHNNDTDMDGLLDGDEVNIYGTDPTRDDSDGDGYSDYVEVGYGSNPNDSESCPQIVTTITTPISVTEMVTIYAAPPYSLHYLIAFIVVIISLLVWLIIKRRKSL